MLMCIRQMQCICDQRRDGSGCQQKERRAKHNRAIKFGKYCLIWIGPRIEPHQQERNYEIL